MVIYIVLKQGMEEPVIKLRAISKDEKLERREAILDTASALLEGNEYAGITMADIARKAGLAKGTVFLYFKTKEELFLQLQVRGYLAWFKDINERLQLLTRQKQKTTIQKFVKVLIASLSDNPAFLRLTPILHVILERNIGYQTALEFKRLLLNEIITTGRLIEQCLPFLRDNDGAQFLPHLQVLFIGLIQMTQPAAVVKQVLEKEGMEVFQMDFAEKISEMIILIIKGMKSAA